LQTTFVLRVFEIRGGDISARSLKVQKIEEKRGFPLFLRQNTVLFKCPGKFFRFSCSQPIFTPKKSSSRIWMMMLTQNLVEVGSVCGPGIIQVILVRPKTGKSAQLSFASKFVGEFFSIWANFVQCPAKNLLIWWKFTQIG
jgi:hypothetical protein